ncbi:MAG: hypothetical protein HOI35_03085 [Woeseia sp.]|nr:hypothetical protein [Woeseia sp.]MBT6208990.1 hypothetical protein [Woeseia sp.]
MPYCDRTLQHLLRTFIEITLLRQGPQDVPSRSVVLVVAIGLLLFAFLSTAVAMPETVSGNIAISFFVSVLSYVVYWLVLLATGFGRRLVPTIASIMACGSILTILHVVVFVVMRQFTSDVVTDTVAWLILIWAIPVKGNIIARSIEQHWFAGIAIAMTIFVMQNITYIILVNL